MKNKQNQKKSHVGWNECETRAYTQVHIKAIARSELRIIKKYTYWKRVYFFELEG